MLNSLEDFAIIRVEGEDAESFLQKQLSVDMSEVTDTDSRLAAYLNPKGRVFATFIVVKQESGYFFLIAKDLVEPLINRLKVFVFRARVSILACPELALAGYRKVHGPAASFVLERPYETQTSEGVTVVKMAGEVERYLSVGSATELVHRFAADEQLDPADWLLEELKAGIPWICQATSEMFTAQAINLDLLGAVSWTKGCYPGQEIVARLHYRGGVNRRTLHATCNAQTLAEPGDLISCPALAGKQTGNVVNFSRNDKQQSSDLLISVPLKFIEQENLLLSESAPIKLNLDGLPYSIPEV